MFARVVPAIRSPLGVEHFDYLIPEGLAVNIGDLVMVQFRKTPTPALVTALLQDSPFATKAKPVLGLYGELRFPESMIGLLEWTARWTFSSQPTVFGAWVRNLPKRTPELGVTRYALRDTTQGKMNVTWAADAQGQILERARQNPEKRILLITPQKATAQAYAETLSARLLLSDLADGAAFRAWSEWLAAPSGVLVTTRVGAWLSPCADLVLLDQPEQDDHKQDELTPRYDARKLAAWSAQHAGTMVEAIGITPTLATQDPAPTIDCDLRFSVRHPNARSPIPMLQPDALNTLREHEGKRIIIHPIRGESARFTCRDCGWQATCPSCGFATASIEGRALCRRCGWKGDAPLECAACGGYDLGKSLPGIEKLKSAWLKHEPDIEVEWRTMSVEDMERPIPEGSLVVVTDANLLAGVVEDIRRDERLVVAIRRLASRTRHLILQTDEALALKVAPWLTTEGFDAFRAAERSLRASFGYPPATRLVKLISETEVRKAPFEVRGPFPVAFRVKSRKPRLIYHVIPPSDLPTEALIKALLPLAKTVIIDLDPIAFFR
jgi:primosomal protein N'